jgi:hypothetical protein
MGLAVIGIARVTPGRVRAGYSTPADRRVFEDAANDKRFALTIKRHPACFARVTVNPVDQETRLCLCQVPPHGALRCAVVVRRHPVGGDANGSVNLASKRQRAGGRPWGNNVRRAA